MKFLTGLCQDDVTTWRGDVTSRNKLHSHVRKKILGKVTERILELCYGSGVMQLKVGLGVNLPPPPLVLWVLTNDASNNIIYQCYSKSASSAYKHHNLAFPVVTASISKISLPQTSGVFRLHCARVPFQAAIYGDPFECRNQLLAWKYSAFFSAPVQTLAAHS